MVDVIKFARKMNIKIRGSRKTSRLRKKRYKHLEELRLLFWELYRKKKGITSNYVKGETDVLGRKLKSSRFKKIDLSFHAIHKYKWW